MKQTFVNYLKSINLTTDTSSKIQIALTQLIENSCPIYFKPTSTINAVATNVNFEDLGKHACHKISGSLKTFCSSDELVFSPATLPYKRQDNWLTIGNFLDEKTPYCIVVESIFLDDGYFLKPYEIDLYGPNIFVDCELDSYLLNPNQTNNQNAAPNMSTPIRRKQVVVDYFEETRAELKLSGNATNQEVYNALGSPTRRQLWETLAAEDEVAFYHTESNRSLEVLADIAKELDFKFKSGRPTFSKKIKPLKTIT